MAFQKQFSSGDGLRFRDMRIESTFHSNFTTQQNETRFLFGMYVVWQSVRQLINQLCVPVLIKAKKNTQSARHSLRRDTRFAPGVEDVHPLGHQQSFLAYTC